MTNPLIMAPSILASDFSRLGEEVRAVVGSHAFESEASDYARNIEAIRRAA
jgi:hypothetical protein